MKIEVTQKHIDRGYQKRAGRCPIALALIDAGLKEPLVCQAGITYGSWGSRKEMHPPLAAADFITLFDIDRLAAKPFSFELNAV